ncbi:MAG TPA: hypothetical protein VKU19_06110 [Bryobacteraceae bacterium]|nr:hypothetical protein [Bryobacteraceae bacterium]
MSPPPIKASPQRGCALNVPDSLVAFLPLAEVQAAAIRTVTSRKSAAESTHAMPVTRDMSEGKRHALHLWIYLVSA